MRIKDSKLKAAVCKTTAVAASQEYTRKSGEIGYKEID
jgi:hypothetical protein